MRAACCFLLLAAALASVACSPQLPEGDFERVVHPGKTAAPILLIGVDGFEWNVILPLLERGEMPVLENLMARGSYGLLETSQPTSSPIIWTTIATGKEASRHGIKGFLKNEQTQELYTNSDRRTKALWNIASDYGKRVAAVGWWMTYPVEPVNGVMIAQRNTARAGLWKGRIHQGVPRQVWPAAREAEVWTLAEEVERDLPDFIAKVFGSFPHALSAAQERAWRGSQWAFRADHTYFQAAAKLLEEEGDYDLLMVYFGGADVLGHRFWRYHEPEAYAAPPTELERENLGGVIEDYYRQTDASIGALLDRLGDEGTVIVISDHGMGAVRKTAQSFSGGGFSGHHFQAPPGVFVAAGPHVRGTGLPEVPSRGRLVEIASIYDLAPTILALLRIPVGRDMEGDVMGGIVEPDFDLGDQPQPVSTHDTRRFMASRPRTDAEHSRDGERLEQLRGLGYIQ